MTVKISPDPLSFQIPTVLLTSPFHASLLETSGSQSIVRPRSAPPGNALEMQMTAPTPDLRNEKIREKGFGRVL